MPITAVNILATAVALVDRDGRILVAERPANKPVMPGYWEFPGGKMEPGETPEACIHREVKEEIGIELGCMAPLSFLAENRVHEVTNDPYQIIVLVYLCREWKGIPQGLEGQRLKWLRPSDLLTVKLLPSNVPLIPLLRDACLYQTC